MDTAGWRKSPHSFSNGACVEVKVDPFDHWRLVRDSKDPDGPVLAFSPGEWNRWVMGIKAAWGTRVPRR
jgi:Domain of unknown function (DUF397)